MIAFVELRVLGNFAIGGIAQARHQAVVIGLRPVLLLLQAMEHDIGIRNALKPRQPALDGFAIGLLPGGGEQPFRPARGVFLLLVDEAHQDLFAPWIGLAIRKVR